ncbi:hypothetical protein LJK88_23620 [Paenibacillus sp. P26]|nr:hypothetical protein LJK88_23620 [Paenibacillus sp. P26]
MKRRRISLMALTVMALGTVAGRGGGGGTPAPDSGKEPSKPAEAQALSQEPVKPLLAQKWSEINDADFKNLIVEPLQSKYPNIQVEMLKGTTSRE